jgi:hypothetical protein
VAVSPKYYIGPRERGEYDSPDSYSNLHAVGHYNGRNITHLFNIKSITVKSLNCKAACFKKNCYDDGVHGLTLVTNNFIMTTCSCLQEKVIPNIPTTPNYMFCSIRNNGGTLLCPGKFGSFVSPINLFHTNRNGIIGTLFQCTVLQYSSHWKNNMQVYT